MKFISDKDKANLKEARAARAKLVAYCKTLPKNSEPTDKYFELNNNASEAINKLPWYLR